MDIWRKEKLTRVELWTWSNWKSTGQRSEWQIKIDLFFNRMNYCDILVTTATCSYDFTSDGQRLHTRTIRSRIIGKSCSEVCVMKWIWFEWSFFFLLVIWKRHYFFFHSITSIDCELFSSNILIVINLSNYVSNVLFFSSSLLRDFPLEFDRDFLFFMTIESTMMFWHHCINIQLWSNNRQCVIEYRSKQNDDAIIRTPLHSIWLHRNWYDDERKR